MIKDGLEKFALLLGKRLQFSGDFNVTSNQCLARSRDFHKWILEDWSVSPKGFVCASILLSTGQKVQSSQAA
jgi:hypothetical protein